MHSDDRTVEYSGWCWRGVWLGASKGAKLPQGGRWLIELGIGILSSSEPNWWDCNVGEWLEFSVQLVPMATPWLCWHNFPPLVGHVPRLKGFRETTVHVPQTAHNHTSTGGYTSVSPTQRLCRPSPAPKSNRVALRACTAVNGVSWTKFSWFPESFRFPHHQGLHC